MGLKVCIFLVFFAFAVADTVRAQISQAGTYFGKIGTNDLVVAVIRHDAVNLIALDYTGRTLDGVATGLDAANSSTGQSPRGKAYSFQIRDGVARGTYGGSSFVAPIEPLVGAYYDKRGGYNGVIQDSARSTGFATVSFFATGKVMLVYGSSSGDSAGVGQVSSSGQVTIPMSDGNFYSFVFRPDPVLLVASSGPISVNGRSALNFAFFGNSQSKMVNISTRGTVSSGTPMFAGFVINNFAKTVLIRGIGPTLAQFGVSAACPDTQLTLYSGQALIASNNDWSQQNANSAGIVSSSAQVGAFPLQSSSCQRRS
jgi:hypothetical protein